MQVESLIKLLTETLKFYANEANYSNNNVQVDRGHQARHILKLVEDNQQTIQSFEKLFDEFQENIGNKTSPEEIIKMVNELTSQNGR